MSIAVVTGAAQGIGRRTAEVLAERGYALALSDLREPVETLRDMERLGAEAFAWVGDITDEATVAGFGAAVRERFQRVDVLVNNAGISCIAPAERLSIAQFRKVIDVNLIAPFHLAQLFGAMMLEQGAGSIIN